MRLTWLVLGSVLALVVLLVLRLLPATEPSKSVVMSAGDPQQAATGADLEPLQAEPSSREELGLTEPSTS